MSRIYFCIKLFVLFTSFALLNDSYAQEITVDDFNSLGNSFFYNYNGDNYTIDRPYTGQPNIANLPLIARALAIRQARYNNGVAIVKSEYSKLKSLRLINSDNQKILIDHRSKVSNYLNGEGGKLDYSIQRNVSSVIEYITWIYSLETIRHEILLDQKLHMRFVQLKNKEPDTYYNSVTFSGIKKVIADLKAISKEKISTLAVQNGLL